jgi:hypothetical protein
MLLSYRLRNNSGYYKHNAATRCFSPREPTMLFPFPAMCITKTSPDRVFIPGFFIVLRITDIYFAAV